MKQRKPRKITPSYLENSALFYLQRYATSVENFHQVMKRKIDRSCLFHEEAPAQHYPLINDLIEKFKRAGLLDDNVYAQSKARSLRRKGSSTRMIEQTLRTKGVDDVTIDHAITETDTELGFTNKDPDFESAKAYIKRRRLGIYRKRKDDRSDQKDLASLARAGYSYYMAKKALDSIKESAEEN